MWTTRRFCALAGAAATAVSSLTSASAFSFNINNTPQQCSNLSISITGSGGTPPYHVLILPFGGSPLPNAIEARKILDEPFGDGQTSVSFQLPYPASSQFVVVVSDNKTFGSGGTSAAATVQNSSDASCFDATHSVSPDFFYNLDPLNQIVQCTTSRVWWNPSDVQGDPTFYGVIPGGDSFNIPYSNPQPRTNEGIGFDWVPPVRGGTVLMLGSGDNRGLGAGGSVTYFVSSGNQVTSCLNETSPSSTAGSPAGGQYPTSTSGAGTGGGGGGSNTGAIVGGVVGGIVALAALVILLLALRRRRRYRRAQGEKPDLFTDNERPSGDVQQLAPPEPFIVPPASETGTSVPGSQYGYGVGNGAAATGAGAAGMHAEGSRLSVFSERTEGDSAYLRPGTPQTAAQSEGTSTSAGRKGGQPVLRPVNIIQHEDAGAPPAEGEQEAETVELPPAYTNIRNT